MTSEWLNRKELRSKLDKVTQKDWIQVAERLSLPCEGGKGSHCVIRNTKFPINDIRSVISTVQSNLYREANLTIFKNLVNYGISEDDIWRALKIKIKV